MIRRACVVLFILLTGSAVSAEQGSIAEEGDRLLRPLVERELVSGTVLIGREGRIQFVRGYGMADREHAVPNRADTKFRLGSITKQFTAMGILVLAERGVLSVDDPLSKFLPDYPHADRITLHHLLTHTSGVEHYNRITDYDDQLIRPLTIDQVIEWFGGEPLTFEPGERFGYSNSGYVLLAKVIEVASGQAYEDFLRESIFEPLEMWDTSMDVATRVLGNRARGYGKFNGEIYAAPYRDMPFTSGAGSLVSTVLDLYKWDRALAEGRLISPKLYARMFAPEKAEYGYGWFVRDLDGRRVHEHSGAINGFLGQIRRYPDEDVVVIGLLNYESTFFPEVQNGLAAIALGEEPAPALSTDALPLSEALKRSAGRYRIDAETIIELFVTEEGIRAVLGDAKPDMGLVQNESRIFFPNLNLMVDAESNEAGRVESLRLLQGAQRLRAARLE